MSKIPIYLKIFNKQYDMNSTLIRFQEYSESPKFRHLYFTLDDYMDYYVKQFGKFDYFDKVRGMNIPGYVFNQIYNEDWFTFEYNDYTIPTTLRPKESNFLRYLENRIPEFHEVDKPYYFIAVNKEDKQYSSLLKHEFAHGCFYTNKKYQREVRDYLKLIPSVFNPLRENLRKDGGYHRAVVEDELHAFLLTGWRTSWQAVDSRLEKHMLEAGRDLDDIFKSNFGFSLKKSSKEAVLKLVKKI